MNDEPRGFEAVLGDELKAIGARRIALDAENGSLASSGKPVDDAWRGRLLGLAFSGGGIRSATFNLGVLQALAHYGLLRHVDYLSTVSGGGYIGSWLTALSQRTFACAAPKEGQRSLPEGKGLMREVRRRLTKDAPDEPAPGGARPFTRAGYEHFEREIAWSAGSAAIGQRPAEDSEHDAIRFLRQFSNYLTPDLGIFSGDTWALISIYLRNALINLLVLVSFVALVMLVPRWLSALFTHLAQEPATSARSVWQAVGSAAFVLVNTLIVAGCLGRNLAGISDTERAPPNARGSVGVILTLLLPVLLVGISAAAWLPQLSDALSNGLTGYEAWVVAALAGGAGAVLLWSVAFLSAVLSPWWRRSELPFWTGMLHYGLYAGLLFGVGLFAAGAMIGELPAYGGFRLIVAPPLLALGILTAGVVHIGLAAKQFSSHYSEWLSRLGGLMCIGAIGWIALTALVFLSPIGLSLLESKVAQIGLGSGWLLTTVSALILGKTKTGPTPSWLLRTFMAVAPWLFVVGLFVIVAAALQAVLDVGPDRVLDPPLPEGNVARLARAEHWLSLLAATVIMGLLTLVLSRRVDINTFSLNSLYANRLVRCYLGASVSERWANPFSGLSSQDDLSLFALPKRVGDRDLWVHADTEGRATAHPAGDPERAAYPGPYHLVNTAINLVAGRSLAWQERKAGSFLLSPLYCGYHWRIDRAADGQDEHVDAYRPSTRFSSDPKHLTLGEAVATSGAAASPNMGFHSKPAFTFLMGVFNIRLGRWIGNPSLRAGRHAWRKSGPSFAVKHLLWEVFGLTNSDSNFVYLSDGGHFENLGLYELVRRRCRYVIVCDSGADEHYRFEDLANAVRKCRIDLGVEIDLDVRQIASIDEKGYNSAPCAIGNIRYDGGRIGTILYLKACRRQGFPSDILHYAAEQAAFPHETTADQFFSESQFESYRRLGHYLADGILGAVMPEGRPDNPDVDKIFRNLREHWHGPSSPVNANFTRLAQRVDLVFERLRESEGLAFLSRQFYPEWRSLLRDPSPLEQADEMWLIPENEEVFRQAFYFCSSLIQLMESVYIDLGLETEWEHPDNSGWINLFNHWTWSGMFRVTWAVVASTYGRRFRSFCQRRLGLELGVVDVVPIALPGEVAELAGSPLNVLERRQVNELLGRKPPEGDTVYSLELRVEKPLTDEHTPEEKRFLRRFNFGYAVLEGDELLMFRVQDHLRNMELGRRGLKRLVEQRAGRRERVEIRHVTPIAARLRRLGERADEAKIADFCSMLASVNEEVSDELWTDAGTSSRTVLELPADRHYGGIEAGSVLTVEIARTGEEHSLHATLRRNSEALRFWRSEELEDEYVRVPLTEQGAYHLEVHAFFFGDKPEAVSVQVRVDGRDGEPEAWWAEREAWCVELDGREARARTATVAIEVVPAERASSGRGVVHGAAA